MKKNPCSALLLLPVLAVALLLTACGSKTEESMQSQVKSYYAKDITPVGQSKGYSAYFDLSDGVVLAYQRNQGAAQFLSGTVQRLTSGDSCSVFSLAADKITPLNLHQTDLYNKIMDQNSYTQEMAPIEKTLDKIVKEGKSSLLVTDFEEYTPNKMVQHQSFATRYFTDWLKRGNDITFFVFDFVGVKNIHYHLYFIVFDNKSHELLNYIKEATTGTTGYQEFHLSTDAYSVSTEYPSATKGGNYHENGNGDDLITSVLEDGSEEAYTNFGKSARMEYYPFGVKWSDALKNSQDAKEAGFKPQYTDIFRHLFFDFSNQDSYIIKKLAVRVTDVEKDFDEFEDYLEAVNDKDDHADYYDDNGKLLQQFDYTKHHDQPVEIKDMLELDQNLFNQTMASSGGKKVEIGIGFSPNFNGKIVGGEDNDLYRIDVVIDDCQPNLSPRIDELFSWGANNNLRDAIRNTLQNLNPRGTVIYSYFVKVLD